MGRDLHGADSGPSMIVDGSLGPVRVTDLGERIAEVLRLLPRLGVVTLETASSGAVSEIVGGFQRISLTTWLARVDEERFSLRLGLRPIRFARALRDRRGGDERSHRIELLDASRAVLHRVIVRDLARIADFDELVAIVRARDQGDDAAPLPAWPPLRRLARGSRSEAELLDARTAWYSTIGDDDGHALTRDLGVSRRLLLRMLGEEWAVPIAVESLARVVTAAASQRIPVTVTVSNDGCSQTWRGLIDEELTRSDEIVIAGAGARIVVRPGAHHTGWLVRAPGLLAPRRSVELLDGAGDPVITIALAEHLAVTSTPRERWVRLVGGLPGLPTLQHDR